MARHYPSGMFPADIAPATAEKGKTSVDYGSTASLGPVGWVTAGHRRRAAVLVCDHVLDDADPEAGARDLLDALGLLRQGKRSGGADG